MLSSDGWEGEKSAVNYPCDIVDERKKEASDQAVA